MSVDETRCPNCGRFVGTYERCPYCGANIPKRLNIKIFRYGSLVFSFIGLIILYFTSVHQEIPLVKINEISSAMNFAYIRVKGTVCRYPLFDKKLATFTVQLDDGTEDIIVKAYRTTALKLKKLNKIPRLGDIMDVEGTVRIKGAQKILIINVPERVKIIHTPFMPVKLSDIFNALINKRVTVTGIVSDIRYYYRKYIALFITDINGKNKIKIPINLNILGRNIPKLDVGYKIKVRGVLSYYAGYYNVVPVSAKSIKVVSYSTNIPEYKISEITSDEINRIIKTSGKITKFRKSSEGVTLTISDSEFFIYVMLWNDIYNAFLSKSEIKEGAVVSVTGRVEIYKGKLQIVPKKVEDFVILEKAEELEEVEEKEKFIPFLNIGEIKTNDLGKIIKVSGKIIDYYEFNKGRILTLKDNTGELKVVLWNDILENIQESEYIISGTEIAVEGKVSQYNGGLQIVPKYAQQVEIIKKIEKVKEPFLEKTSPNSISTNK